MCRWILHRPFEVLGLNFRRWIDGSEVTGFDTHQAGAMDFASALHGLNHALNSDAFAASAAGAMDFSGAHFRPCDLFRSARANVNGRVVAAGATADVETE